MRRAGFTLLEMIVVLAILGLASALVAPATIRGIDSWRRQAQLDALIDQIRALPGEARSTGVAIVVDDATLAGDKPPLRVEGDWTLTAPAAWTVSANGVCQGGQISIVNALGARTVAVAAPFCDPSVLP
jgi:prepilin-type N-terminal cleavage/methylation domain-containing protein